MKKQSYRPLSDHHRASPQNAGPFATCVEHHAQRLAHQELLQRGVLGEFDDIPRLPYLELPPGPIVADVQYSIAWVKLRQV